VVEINNKKNTGDLHHRGMTGATPGKTPVLT
jgi:hypothetical protein